MERKSDPMERAQKLVEVSEEDDERVSELKIPSHQLHVGPSFYEDFALRGIRVDRVDSTYISCTFRVPPRLLDRDGSMAGGAIANLIDIVGNALIYKADRPMNVSVDMSISYLSTAKAHDELEVSSKLLGNRGLISETSVVIKNKATGQLIAQGRHSLFSRPRTKL
ncbi:hypothetical protein V2J09_005955 [Rumex salicifolius]